MTQRSSWQVSWTFPETFFRVCVGVFWCIFGSTQLSLSSHVESSYDQQPDSVCVGFPARRGMAERGRAQGLTVECGRAWALHTPRDARRALVILPHCLLRMCCFFDVTPPTELQRRIERHVRCPPQPRGAEGDGEGRPWLVRRQHVGVYASAVSTSWPLGAKKLKKYRGGGWRRDYTTPNGHMRGNP